MPPDDCRKRCRKLDLSGNRAGTVSPTAVSTLLESSARSARRKVGHCGCVAVTWPRPPPYLGQLTKFRQIRGEVVTSSRISTVRVTYASGLVNRWLCRQQSAGSPGGHALTRLEDGLRAVTDFMWSGGQGDRQARSDSAGGGRRAIVPQAAVPKAADASACGGSHGTSLSLSAAASRAITSQSSIKAALACSVLQRWHQARSKEH